MVHVAALEAIVSRVVRTGLKRARLAGWQGVLILGDPGCYRRLGFDPGFAMLCAGPRLTAFPLGPGLRAGGDSDP